MKFLVQVTARISRVGDGSYYDSGIALENRFNIQLDGTFQQAASVLQQFFDLGESLQSANEQISQPTETAGESANIKDGKNNA
jgi:hypothetical protein